MNTPLHFQRIGLFAKQNDRAVADTFRKLTEYLSKQGHTLFIEAETITLLDHHYSGTAVSLANLGTMTDLVIVVGGDGSLLKAGRAIVEQGTPILGINRGRLGFLADILPEHLEYELSKILEGHYQQETRTLLHAQVIRHQNIVGSGTALNDVILFAGGVARMIEFEVFINQDFVLRQRSDGLIAATPTGSTAYALSGGGPIVYPSLQAIVLVPMFPHTLTRRPLVINDQSQITLHLSLNNQITSHLSCDGQFHLELAPGDEIVIKRYAYSLRLIHPEHHNYFEVLRQKLGWSTQC